MGKNPTSGALVANRGKGFNKGVIAKGRMVQNREDSSDNDDDSSSLVTSYNSDDTVDELRVRG